MRILKIISVAFVSIIVIYLIGLFLFGLLFGHKIDWTQGVWREKWDKYTSQEYGFSFEYPPTILVEEEDISDSLIKNAQLLLSLSVRGNSWGTIYVVPADQNTRSPNYLRSEPVKIDGDPVVINGNIVEKEINLTNDQTKHASIATELPLSKKSNLKLRFVIAFELTDDIKTRELKEKYFNHMIASLKIN